MTGGNAHFDKLCTVGGSTTDETTDASDTDAADFDLGNDALSTGVTYVYYGMKEIWKTAAVNIGTPGVTGTVTWSYWDGDSWEALTPSSDGSNNYRNAGNSLIVMWSTTPPTGWAETTVTDCTTDAMYFIRSTVGTSYTTIPRGTQASALEFNLKVKVQDELSNTVAGLASTAFTLRDGTTKTVFSSRDLGSGQYELAVDTLGSDRNFNVEAQKDGYVTSAGVATGTQSTTLTDITGTPLSLKYAVKVTPDTEITGVQTITGATVTTGNSFGVTCDEPGTPDGTYYCAVPVSHTGTDVKIAKDGYKTKTLTAAFTDRTTNSGSQRVVPERLKEVGGKLASSTAYGAAVWDDERLNMYIFGGNDGSRSNKIIKYNPADDSVQIMSATLPTAREAVSAAWDANSDVAYIFGGSDSTGTLNDILKYDPATDTITDTDVSLPAAVDHASAVWDTTDDVGYVIGGWTVGASNAIYKWDPNANSGAGASSTEAATLPTGRSGLAAIYDPTGDKVWIFGGWNVVQLDDILYWTPGGGSVSESATALPSGLEDPSAVYDDATRYAYIFGGYTGTAVTDDIVRFKTSDETKSTLSEALPTARKKTMAVWDNTNSRVYIAGGELSSGRTDQIVRYTPSSASVATTPVLPSARIAGAAAMQGGNAYVFGGIDGSTRKSDIVKFDPSTRVVTTRSASFSSAREGAAAASDGSYIYIFGGQTSDTAFLDAILKYDVSADSLTTLSATLPSARGYGCAVWDSTNSKFYIFGGKTSSSGFTNQIIEFNPSSNTVTTVSATLPTAGAWMSCIFDGTNAYVFGGYANGASGFTTVVRYAPSTSTVTTMSGAFASGRYWTSAVWDGSDAYIFGGTASDSDDIIRYTPSTDTVTNMETLFANDKFSTSTYGTVAVWDSTNTKAYVFGGEQSSARITTIYEYKRGINLELQYAFKVTQASSEASTTLTSATVKAGDSFGTTCTESAGAWYCAVPLAETGLTIRFEKDGYVTNEDNAFASDRTVATADQVTKALTGIMFAYKVTSITTEGSTNPTSVTATTGNSYGTTCTEYSSSWYCAVPLADTGTTIKLVKDGYVTSEANSFASDRTGATDAQVTKAITGFQFSLAITVSTETSLSDVTWEKKVGAGDYASVTATATSAGVAYFAQTTSESDLVYRATKCSVSADTGTAFTTSASSQTTKTLSIVCSLSSLSTSAGNLAYGATPVSYTFGFTLNHPWPANGKLDVTFPTGYTVSTDAATLSGADGTATVSVSSRTVTVTRANDGSTTAANTAVTVVVNKIKNPTATGDTGTFALSLQNNGGTALDTGSTPLVTITAAVITTITVAPDGPTVTVAASQTFTATAVDTYGNSISFTATWSASASCGSITTGGVYTAPTTAGSCTVTATSGSVSDASTVTVAAGALASITVSPTSVSLVRSTGTQTFSGTGADTYGNSVSVSPTWTAGCGSINSGTGAYTAGATIESCTVTATSGSTTGTATVNVISCTPTEVAASGGASFSGVTAGTGKALKVLIQCSGAAPAEGAIVTWAVTAGGGSLSASTSAAAADGIAQITLTTGTTVGTNTVTATYTGITGSPVSFTVTSVAGDLATISVSPAAPSVVAGQTQTFTASGADQYSNSITVSSPTWSAGCGAITSGGVYTAAGGTTTCTITATSGSISGTATATTTAGALTSLATSASNTTASVTTTYAFTYKLANAWPADGKAVLALPTGFSTTSPTATLSGADGAASISVSGQTVTVTRSGGTATAASTTVILTITSVNNPVSDGSSGTFTITTKTTADASIDTGAAPAVSITTNGLSITGLASTSHPASSWKTTTTLSITWSAPSDTTATGYSWALNAQPDTTVDGGGLSASAGGMADGIHTFYVKAQSSRGDWGPVASYSLIYVDTVAPQKPVISSGSHPASGCSASTSASVAWSASDERSGLDSTSPYGYALDSASLTSTAASGLTFSSLADGSHTVRVRATDRAGNVAEADYTFSVDKTAPSLALTAPAYAKASGWAIAWTASDGCAGVNLVEFDYKAPDSTTWKSFAVSNAATGSVAFSGLSSDGIYEFRARATDKASNVGSHGTPVATVLDRVAPSAPASIVAFAIPGGDARIQWDAATDERSGVAGYVVYRLGDDGSRTRLNADLVTGREYVDHVQLEGALLRYTVTALDKAGNEGPSKDLPQAIEVKRSAPTGTPTDFTADGLVQGLLTKEKVRLLWTPVSDAWGYALYAGNSTAASARLGVTQAFVFEVPGPADGRLYFTLVARDEIGNEGPPVMLAFIRDVDAPVSKASAPAESGPAISVAWTAADAGLGLARVELWAQAEGGQAARFFTSANPKGSATYSGVAGTTYGFWAVGIDHLGRAESKTAAEAKTLVTSNTVSAGGSALALVQTLLATSSGASLDQPFAVVDTDMDGYPETFVDPNKALVHIRDFTLDTGELAFLLGVKDDGATQESPVVLWNPANGEAAPVALARPIEPVKVQSEPNGRISATVTVDKGGWIYIPVDDTQPELLIESVLRGDGSQVPIGYYWRAGDKVIVVDDPSTEYSIVYAPVAPIDDSIAVTPLALLAVLLALGTAVTWLEWPSASRLALHPPARRTLAWALRHCAECGRALLRPHRLVRWFHDCGGFGGRLAGHKFRWQSAGFQTKVLQLRSLHKTQPWLLEPHLIQVAERLPSLGPRTDVALPRIGGTAAPATEWVELLDVQAEAATAPNDEGAEPRTVKSSRRRK